MPRFFIETSGDITVKDDEGVECGDRSTLQAYVRAVLTQILQDEGARTGSDEFTAQVFNEAGRIVMRAKAGFTVIDDD